MEAYPSKVRELVLDAYDAGLRTKEIATRFKVSPSWARRAKQRLRERGLRAALRAGQERPGPEARRRRPADGWRRRLAALVGRTPGATLAERKAASGLPVSVSTRARALADLRLTLEKSPPPPPSRTART